MATNKKPVKYIYNLDTGNSPYHHPTTPPPTAATTTKKPSSRSFGSLLRRSKTYKENTQEDQKEIVQESKESVPAVDGGRKPAPAIESGRKSVPGVGEGRKVGVGVVAGRRSAENRAEMVMINVAAVAAMVKVKVLVTDMPAFMQVHAFRCARKTFDSMEKFSPKQIASNMKKAWMNEVYYPFDPSSNSTPVLWPRLVSDGSNKICQRCNSGKVRMNPF